MWGNGSDWGMMGSWGGTWWGPFGMIIWLLLLVAIVIAIVWFVRSVTQAGGRERTPSRSSSGLEILEERYARGEIDREEDLQKERDLTG